MLNGIEIKDTDHYNYLGVTFTDANDRFNRHFDAKHDKALRAIFKSRSLVREAAGSHMSIMTQLKVFDTQIQPILNYGCEVWYSGKTKKRLEALHTKYIKRVLGVKCQTSTLAIYGETGRCPMLVRQEQLVIGYWLKMMSLPSCSPVKSVYLELLKVSNAGHHTWCTEIAALMGSIGYGDIWTSQSIPCDLAGIRRLKHKLQSAATQKYADEWVNDSKDIRKHPILRTYIRFKTNFIIEPYLKLVTVTNHRRAISQLRVSSHRLAIETGRHSKPPVPAADRICKYCVHNAIDDETHFITSCDFHALERNDIYSVACEHIANFSTMDNLSKFVAILSSREREVLSALGHFVFNGFKKRARSEFISS